MCSDKAMVNYRVCGNISAGTMKAVKAASKEMFTEKKHPVNAQLVKVSVKQYDGKVIEEEMWIIPVY